MNEKFFPIFPVESTDPFHVFTMPVQTEEYDEDADDEDNPEAGTFKNRDKADGPLG